MAFIRRRFAQTAVVDQPLCEATSWGIRLFVVKFGAWCVLASVPSYRCSSIADPAASQVLLHISLTSFLKGSTSPPRVSGPPSMVSSCRSKQPSWSSEESSSGKTADASLALRGFLHPGTYLTISNTLSLKTPTAAVPTTIIFSVVAAQAKKRSIRFS